MAYGEEFHLLGLNWLRIHFVENNGMAFGLQFGGSNGKLALSLFRLLAVLLLTYYLTVLLKTRAPFSLISSFAFILAGALGNIIDSAFYGVIFSASGVHGGIAQLFPPEGGYASFFYGKVVDMFYMPVWAGVLPSWIPFAGGQYVQFFKPVFNLADLSITMGVIMILFFHSTSGWKEKKEVDTAAPPDEMGKSSESTDASSAAQTKLSSEPGDQFQDQDPS